MPSRIVREGINSSPRINALSMGAEVFYRRLMSVADDFGRYHGSVVTLRGACWPTNPERISERDVKKWLTELLKGEQPLLKTYNIRGAVYVELQDFGQQVRGKSKFPDPPWLRIQQDKSNLDVKGISPSQSDGSESEQETVSASRSRSRIRSRIAEAEAKSEGPPVCVPAASWQADATYEPFVAAWMEVAQVTGKPIIPEDFAEAHFRWRGMDPDQKSMAVANSGDYLSKGVWTGATDPRFIPLPGRFLEREYKRPVIAPKARAPDGVRLHKTKQQELADRVDQL